MWTGRSLTDYAFHDDNAVHYSLAIAGTVASVGAVLLLVLGLRPYRESVARLPAVPAAA